MHLSTHTLIMHATVRAHVFASTEVPVTNLFALRTTDILHIHHLPLTCAHRKIIHIIIKLIMFHDELIISIQLVSTLFVICSAEGNQHQRPVHAAEPFHELLIFSIWLLRKSRRLTKSGTHALHFLSTIEGTQNM